MIALDSVTSGKASAGGSGANVTVPHTCTGTNLILLVAVTIDDSNQEGHLSNTVSYNGTPLTLIVRADTGSGQEFRSEIWGLLAPPTGSALNVVVNYSFLNYVGVGAMSFTGVDQTALPSITGVTTNLTGAAPTTTLTTTFDNAMLVDAIESQSVETAGSGQTLAWQNQGQSYQNGASSYKAVGAAGAYSMSWGNTSGGVAQAVLALKPAASAPTVSNSYLSLLGVG